MTNACIVGSCVAVWLLTDMIEIIKLKYENFAGDSDTNLKTNLTQTNHQRNTHKGNEADCVV
jgi:hypothetical protein